MEFAASALTSMASAAGTAGAAVGEAVAGATAAAGSAASSIGSFLPSGSLVSGILSGGASLLQMAQLRRAGDEKARSLEMQAADVPTEIAGENIKANERAGSLKRALLQTIGERDAAAGASGVDLSFGTPAKAREEASDDAERALAISAGTTGSAVGRLNEKAGNLMLMAREARRSSRAEANIAGLTGLARIGARG